MEKIGGGKIEDKKTRLRQMSREESPQTIREDVKRERPPDVKHRVGKVRIKKKKTRAKFQWKKAANFASAKTKSGTTRRGKKGKKGVVGTKD